MRRKTDLIILIAFLFFLALPAFSEARMVVVLKSADIQPYDEAIEGFEKTCGCDLRQITLSETDRDDAIEEIAEMNPAAVFAVGLDALNAAGDVRGIPVIYSMVPYSPSLSPVQKTASGVNTYIPPQRFLSAMLEVFPYSKRIGTIYDATHSDAFIKEAGAFCQARGIELVAKKISRPGDFPSLIDSMKDRIDLFWMVPDATVVTPEAVQYLLLFSFRNRVPVFTFTKKYVEMGAAAGLYASPRNIGAQAGEVSRKILAGGHTRPVRSDIRKTALVINRKIMNKLGITISSEVLKTAEDAK
jgi:putative ABC transport system substrate-binding protein